MRRLFATCCLALLPLSATAAPLTEVGAYTPAAYAKAGQGGNKAVLLHVVSKFCATCEEQRSAVSTAAEMLPGVEKQAVMMSVALETWKDSRIMDDIGNVRAGTLVLVKDGEVLATAEGVDPTLISALLTAAMPGGGGFVDPATGMALDPATGLPLDPATGLPMDPAMGQPAMGQPAL